jgi:hypothetical protein
VKFKQQNQVESASAIKAPKPIQLDKTTACNTTTSDA